MSADPSCLSIHRQWLVTFWSSVFDCKTCSLLGGIRAKVSKVTHQCRLEHKYSVSVVQIWHRHWHSGHQCLVRV